MCTVFFCEHFCQIQCIHFRSLGCILYELYVGNPPFYTNSIFQLVSLIKKVKLIKYCSILARNFRVQQWFYI